MIDIPDKFYILSQILYIPLCYIDKILSEAIQNIVPNQFSQNFYRDIILDFYYY